MNRNRCFLDSAEGEIPSEAEVALVAEEEVEAALVAEAEVEVALVDEEEVEAALVEEVEVEVVDLAEVEAVVVEAEGLLGRLPLRHGQHPLPSGRRDELPAVLAHRHPHAIQPMGAAALQVEPEGPGRANELH